jgi:hypothetical protein
VWELEIKACGIDERVNEADKRISEIELNKERMEKEIILIQDNMV